MLALALALAGVCRSWSGGADGGEARIAGASRLGPGQTGAYTVEPAAGRDADGSVEGAEDGRIESSVDGEAAAGGGAPSVTLSQPGTMMLEVVVAGDENDDVAGPLEVEVAGPDDVGEELELEPDEPEVDIDGPARVTVGREATYTAVVPTGTPIFWIDGDGRRHRTPELVFTPSRVGVTTFRLSAKIDGRFHIVTRTITVVEG